MRITKKMCIYAIDITMIIFMAWSELVQIGILQGPKMDLKEIWMTSNVAMGLATVLFFHTFFDKD